MFIISPNAHGIRDLYAAREMIEPAVMLGAEQLNVDVLADVVADANQQFYRLLVASAGSPSLSEIMDQLLARMRLVFLRVLQHQPDSHDPYLDVNETVTELLRASDRAAAAETLRKSLGATRERVSLLPPFGDESRSGWL
ncbi:FCD domain-containing protein [Corynebacterium guangdongense]|uniref:DNA-binding GntR family transcriptional regulator n=1 Tax=Corynebacterium guangdongense TaxID=1783348 RepID=A0ABU1ZTZ3_9CORY|nr:FCD domain-containing protein [Corynebacterium guangdongense]MDR7328397.1 DNA-binding GntR family transcriptional regulator [Corynebacterium guangdongense]WJZ16974.1 FCD domain protein [Corynebacterium guangdongense]